MYHFLTEQDKQSFQSAFPFVKTCTAKEYFDFYEEWSEKSKVEQNKPYLINKDSLPLYKDPFVEVLDMSIVKRHDTDVVLKIKIGDITVSPDTIIGWF